MPWSLTRLWVAGNICVWWTYLLLSTCVVTDHPLQGALGWCFAGTSSFGCGCWSLVRRPRFCFRWWWKNCFRRLFPLLKSVVTAIPKLFRWSQSFGPNTSWWFVLNRPFCCHWSSGTLFWHSGMVPVTVGTSCRETSSSGLLASPRLVGSSAVGIGILLCLAFLLYVHCVLFFLLVE